MSDPTPFPKGKPKPRTVKAKTKAPNKTRLLKKADGLFSKLIRSRGFCENCGSTEWLQCAHGFSRRYRATRFDERQCWAICRNCHVYYTHRPLEWDEWMRDHLGVELYEEIRVLALTGPNPDLHSMVLRLESRLREAA